MWSEHREESETASNVSRGDPRAYVVFLRWMQRDQLRRVGVRDRRHVAQKTRHVWTSTFYELSKNISRVAQPLHSSSNELSENPAFLAPTRVRATENVYPGQEEEIVLPGAIHLVSRFGSLLPIW